MIQTATTTRKQTEITSPVVYRVLDKQTHEVMYLVQSDSKPHTFYEVRFDNSALVWRCNCADLHRQCKHSRAVGEVLKLRRLALAAEMNKPLPSRMEQEADRRQHATLNNRNAGFSLLR